MLQRKAVGRSVRVRASLPHTLWVSRLPPKCSSIASPAFSSFLPPFKDQRDRRRILQGVSKRPLRPPPRRRGPAPSSLRRGSAGLWAACIPERNAAFARQALAPREGARGAGRGRGREGNPDFPSTSNVTRRPAEPQPPTAATPVLGGDAGQPSLLSTGTPGSPRALQGHSFSL